MRFRCLCISPSDGGRKKKDLTHKNTFGGQWGGGDGFWATAPANRTIMRKERERKGWLGVPPNHQSEMGEMKIGIFSFWAATTDAAGGGKGWRDQTNWGKHVVCRMEYFSRLPLMPVAQ